MKSILLSIKPKWVAKILNGEKTIEVRKKFPKDFKGWVYIYCTKSQIKEAREYFTFEELPRLGKVVARFYCDKVGIIRHSISRGWIRFEDYYDAIICGCYSYEDLLNESCLKHNEFHNYLKGKNGYGIDISQLEIFDRPKELSEFKATYKYTTCDECPHFSDDNYLYCKGCDGYGIKPLSKAPQNYCYVEVENGKD